MLTVYRRHQHWDTGQWSRNVVKVSWLESYQVTQDRVQKKVWGLLAGDGCWRGLSLSARGSEAFPL